MSEKKSLELRVSVDVGYRRHSVAIGMPDGQVLEEFEITHRPECFREFFSRIWQPAPGSVFRSIALAGHAIDRWDGAKTKG